jgi:hypothetical protein
MSYIDYRVNSIGKFDKIINSLQTARKSLKDEY